MDAILTVTKTVHELGGPSSRPVIAQKMGSTHTSSAFQVAAAAAGYLGFISRTGGGKYDLTSRGENALGSDKRDAEQAMQDGLVSTSFRNILSTFMGRSVDTDVVAIRLREDLDVPETRSEDLAENLVELAQKAGFVTEGSWDAATIEEALERVPEDGDEPEPKPKPWSKRADRPATKSTGGDETERDEDEEVAAASGEGLSVPCQRAVPGMTVNVTVNVDLASVPPEQAIQFLRELREMTSEPQSEA